MWVSGNFPPFTKNILTPKSITDTPNINMQISNNFTFMLNFTANIGKS